MSVEAIYGVGFLVAMIAFFLYKKRKSGGGVRGTWTGPGDDDVGKKPRFKD